MQQKRQMSYRLWTVSIILVLTSVFVLPTAAFADPEAPTHTIFLPVISGQTAEVTQAAPTCGLNEQEHRIEALLLTTPNQGRVRLVCNATLAAVARARAADMGRRAYFDHINPDGQGPNYLVRAAGYQLPSEYSTEVNGNNIESIGAGAGDADGMWNAWMASNKHVTHILGKTSFFAEQIDYGIGFAQVPGSPYQYYWVFISSKPG